jgi:hypothetical protein
MIVDNKPVESNNHRDTELVDRSSLSPLFPYPFVFRNRDELNEYISSKLTLNGVVYYTKVVLGCFTFILPIFNMFMIYRSLLSQEKSFSDVYNIFHSIIFYGEFILVHLLLFVTLIFFIIDSLKDNNSLCLNKGRWIDFLDLEFTLMAFNMIKLIPILSLNGFNFVFTQICISGSIFKNYSRSSKIIAFIVLTFAIFIQFIFLLGLILLLILIKVYQISFVGEIINPLEWKINNWFLFIGFSANIINITDTPTISQLSFMWNITNETWSEDSNIWLHDQLGPKRKIYIFDQISQKIGFIKAFLWVRTMSAIDLHSLVRLPPPDERDSEHL